MRIAHVVSTFPPDIGGMGAVAYNECRELAGRGHVVTVFALNYGSDYSADTQQPFSVVRLRSFIKAGDAGWVPQLFSQLKQFDLAHLHYPFYGGAEWVWLKKKIQHQKYVVTYHMDAAPTTFFKRAIQAVYDLFLAPAILEGAEKILVVDREYFLSSKFAQFLPSEKVIDLPNPVDIEIFQPRSVLPTAVGLPQWENKKILLFVGNLLPVKRLDLLLRALRQLDSNVVLAVVGGGYQEAQYKKIAGSVGVENRVKFIGPSNNPEKLAQYYNVATATVVPSDSESFSLVIGEALASGCPVVASDIPGIRGRVEMGVDGFLCTAGSVESLTENIQKVLNLSDQERKAMGGRGRMKVLEKYSLEAHTKKLLKLYQAL